MLLLNTKIEPSNRQPKKLLFGSYFAIDCYADNPKISPIYVTRELLDFRLRLAHKLMGESG